MTAQHLPAFTPPPAPSPANGVLHALERSERGWCAVTYCERPASVHWRHGRDEWIWLCEEHSRVFEAQG